MIELKIEKRNLLVVLTEEERKQRAEQAAEASALAVQLMRDANAGAERAKADKKQSELKTTEAARLLAVYRDGKESQPVDTKVEYSPVTSEVIVVRLDTHEIVEKRRPTEDDLKIIAVKRQETMDFRPARGRAKRDEDTESKPS